MTNARKQRLLREALGPAEIDVPFPDRTIRTVALIGFVVFTSIALAPSPKAERQVTAVLDTQAAMAGASEGNVQDMTY